MEECLKTVSKREPRYHIMHYLADVHYELHNPQGAERLVFDEVEQLRARGKQRLKAFRRLVLPLIKCYILQQKYVEADSALLELLVIYRGTADLDVADQLGHVRSIIGQARVRWFTSQISSAHNA